MENTSKDRFSTVFNTSDKILNLFENTFMAGMQSCCVFLIFLLNSFNFLKKFFNLSLIEMIFWLLQTITENLQCNLYLTSCRRTEIPVLKIHLVIFYKIIKNFLHHGWTEFSDPVNIFTYIFKSFATHL